MNTTRQTENGQALVLILLAITAIFGFAALAVDMGRLYSERRRAQNAADAAALAAAVAISRQQNYWNAGMNQAALNGFDNNEETNWVLVTNPPESGPYGPDSGLPESTRQEYIQVIITQHVDPIFAQFIYMGNEAVTVEAVSHTNTIRPGYVGNAVHALSTDDDALEMKGTVGVRIENGNLVSNGGGTKNGKSGKVRVEDADINISSEYRCTGCDADTVQPVANEGVPPQMIADIPMPYCPTSNQTHAGVKYYYHASGLGAGTLEAGVHCVKGDINLTGHNKLTGKNVLIVMLDGGIKVAGGATLDLSRADDLVDKNGNQYGGLLIYAPPTNSEVLTLGGNTGSLFQGSIIAPSGTCDIGGTPKAKANHTALICNKVKFHCTPDVNIVYNDAELYSFPTTISIMQ